MTTAAPAAGVPTAEAPAPTATQIPCPIMMVETLATNFFGREVDHPVAINPSAWHALNNKLASHLK